MIGCAFIANSTCRNNDMPDGEFVVEYTCATTGDKLAAAERDEFFNKTCCQRCAHTRVDNCNMFTVEFQIVNGISSHFTAEVDNDGSSTIVADFRDDILKEAQDTAFGDVNWFNDFARLDDGFGCRVKVEYRVNGVCHYFPLPVSIQ